MSAPPVRPSAGRREHFSQNELRCNHIGIGDSYAKDFVSSRSRHKLFFKNCSERKSAFPKISAHKDFLAARRHVKSSQIGAFDCANGEESAIIESTQNTNKRRARHGQTSHG